MNRLLPIGENLLEGLCTGPLPDRVWVSDTPSSRFSRAANRANRSDALKGRVARRVGSHGVRGARPDD
jgi:hypothetical protein